MKRLEVIENLEIALAYIDELLKASRGEESRCGCKGVGDIDLYVKTWIKAPMQDALDEIKRNK